MKIRIDGAPVPTSEVVRRSFGFGKDVPSETARRYKFVINAAEISEVLKAPYDEFTAEMKADDLIEGEPALPQMQALGYPTFDSVRASHPDLLVEAVREYLYDDVFAAAFKGSAQTYRFALTSVENVELRDGDIVIEGVAIAARPVPGEG